MLAGSWHQKIYARLDEGLISTQVAVVGGFKMERQQLSKELQRAASKAALLRKLEPVLLRLGSNGSFPTVAHLVTVYLQLRDRHVNPLARLRKSADTTLRRDG